MTFTESIATCFGKYADFSGRAKRPEFWWFALGMWILSLILMPTYWSSISDPYTTDLPAGLIFSLLVSLALLLPYLAAAVRRLHDTGKSGGYLFIALIPFVGTIILLVWLATEGQPGANQYGEPPAR